MDIYIGKSKVGSYNREASGATFFKYDQSWLDNKDSFQISLSMPLSNKVWKGAECSHFFDGLLPDLKEIREKIAAREHAESARTFDLLAAIGRDCVGALRFIPESEDPGDPTQMNSRILDDQEIENRLNKLASAPLGMDKDDNDFRISLAGAQEKTAFLLKDNCWHLPIGATPTSHIFKPSMSGMTTRANHLTNSHWNEWMCLELCREYGMDTAKSEVVKFGDTEVIVVERFDRQWRDKVLYRLPQEDLCQAMGYSPEKKYQSDGGPSIVDILSFLNSSSTPHKDKLTFFKAQILFWLLAAIDGHAKNFSISLSPGGYKLAPLYDVISIAPYTQFPVEKTKLAMSIGTSNHYKVLDILPRHFYQTAQDGGIKKEDVDQTFHDILKRTDGAISAVEKKISAEIPKRNFEIICDGIRKRTNIMRG